MAQNSFSYSTKVPVRFADIDAFGHVNNALFLTYFEIARSNYLDEAIGWDWNSIGLIIARAEIDYLKPVLLEDKLTVYIRTSRLGNSSFDIDYLLVRTTDGKDEHCAQGKTVCVTFDYKQQKSVPIPEDYRKKLKGKE